MYIRLKCEIVKSYLIWNTIDCTPLFLTLYDCFGCAHAHHCNVQTAADVLRTSCRPTVDAFCVPGESYLAVADAFCEREIRGTIRRQEGGGGDDGSRSRKRRLWKNC
jgi:hypothetical protein